MKKNVECFGKLDSSTITNIESLLDSSLALYDNGASNYFIDMDEIESQELDSSDVDSILPKLAEIFKVEESVLKDVSLVAFYGS
ncbi:hypothetical protein [Pseudoalteromonas marina]|uniref:Uncharacterized protein n=1 Tax=Pseudoalteromonas marina TaxID=267375 RepID=A0ABT9FH06_9GAMM|nr:hypothetical protein [Pseudoalteromonas marina]MDP2565776.1 hypothetical protein [Pseudoalteromonas marina]